MMFIEIMYDNKDSENSFVRRRVPIDEIGTLPKSGVLFITLTAEWGNRSALCGRMWSRNNRDGRGWYGEDNYAIGFIAGRFFVKQWADEDEYLLTRSLANPTSTDYQRLATPIFRFPAEAEVHRFKGAYVDDKEWQAARLIFEKEMF